mmetsp:Transcript_1397/g.3572  ORF Transcript_1397/g.3572 Transcript_1397/m.3572 type:complete len:220 (-) Transcript_1397:530-1189(-)
MMRMSRSWSRGRLWCHGVRRHSIEHTRHVHPARYPVRMRPSGRHATKGVPHPCQLKRCGQTGSQQLAQLERSGSGLRRCFSARVSGHEHRASGGAPPSPPHSGWSSRAMLFLRSSTASGACTAMRRRRDVHLILLMRWTHWASLEQTCSARVCCCMPTMPTVSASRCRHRLGGPMQRSKQHERSSQMQSGWQRVSQRRSRLPRRLGVQRARRHLERQQI